MKVRLRLEFRRVPESCEIPAAASKSDEKSEEPACDSLAQTVTCAPRDVDGHLGTVDRERNAFRDIGQLCEEGQDVDLETRIVDRLGQRRFAKLPRFDDVPRILAEQEE